MNIITLDFCMYGAPYRKRTKIACWHPCDRNFLMDLSVMCDKTHQHVNLSGWNRDASAGMMASKKAQAYPLKLCNKWAASLRKSLL